MPVDKKRHLIDCQHPVQRYGGPVKATRRRSWLGAISIFVTFLIILDLIALPLLALQLFDGGYVIGKVDLRGLVPNGLPNVSHDAGGFGGVDLFWTPTGPVQILLFAVGHGLGWVAATLPMLVYAQRTIRQARDHDPFTLAMVHRLRVLGTLVLAGGLAYELAAYLAGRALLRIALRSLGTDSVAATPDSLPTLWWLLPGLLILAFAEVIRHGCLLRAESTD